MSAPELWLPVVGWESLYEVSDLGHVRSLDRIVRYRNGRRHLHRGIQLTPQVWNANEEYLSVRLCHEGTETDRYVHVLVLEAFVGPRPDGMESLHGIDGKLDNSPGNLQWGTRSENTHNQVRDGSHNRARRTHCPRRHRLVAPNLVRAALPKRGCLACNRARGAAPYKHDRRLDITAEADRRYAEIMGEVADCA